LITFLIVNIFLNLVYANSIGVINVKSNINKPFKAVIPKYEDATVFIASADEYSSFGLKKDIIVDSLEILTTDSSIDISSKQPINKQSFNLILKVQNSKITYFYKLIIDFNKSSKFYLYDTPLRVKDFSEQDNLKSNAKPKIIVYESSYYVKNNDIVYVLLGICLLLVLGNLYQFYKNKYLKLTDYVYVGNANGQQDISIIKKVKKLLSKDEQDLAIAEIRNVIKNNKISFKDFGVLAIVLNKYNLLDTALVAIAEEICVFDQKDSLGLQIIDYLLYDFNDNKTKINVARAYASLKENIKASELLLDVVKNGTTKEAELAKKMLQDIN